MKIPVLGTGAVGQAMAKKLSDLGHQVFIGTRDVDQSLSKTETDAWGTPGIGSWIRDKPEIELMNFNEALKNAEELVVFALNGKAAIEGLQKLDAGLLKNKILLDISNPLDFDKGFPPTLSICNDESLGEKIQEKFPELKVVKSLNTVTSTVMANPQLLEGEHSVFVCGNDEGAKQKVTELLQSFGWKSENIIDLGDISSARGTEMLLPLTVRLLGKFQTPLFNININRARATAAS